MLKRSVLHDIIFHVETLSAAIACNPSFGEGGLHVIFLFE